MPQDIRVTISLLKQIPESSLTPSERVLACCAIAREELEVGDYDSGCAALQTWWSLGEWPQPSGTQQFSGG